MRSSRNVIRAEESVVSSVPWQPLHLDALPATNGLDEAEAQESKPTRTMEAFLLDLTHVKTEPEPQPEAAPQTLAPAFSSLSEENDQLSVTPVSFAASNQRLVKGSHAGSLVKDWMPGDFSFYSDTPEAVDVIEELSEDATPDLEEKIQKILEQAERDAQEKADAILRNAQYMANEIIQSAHSDASQVTQEAYDKGIREAQIEAIEMLDLARSVVEEMRLWKELLLSQSESMVVDLVQDIARKLFGDGLVMDAELLGKAFERALAEAKSLGELRIRAHPDDIKILGPLWAVQETAMTGQQIELIPSKDLQRGGCYIEGQFGTVDARVKTQLRLVSETLGKVLASGSPTENEPVVDEEGAEA